MRNSSQLDRRKPVIEVMDPVMADILRNKTEGERLAISWSMWEFARDMLHNHLRSEHPDWAEAQVHHEAARRLAHETR